MSDTIFPNVRKENGRLNDPAAFAAVYLRSVCDSVPLTAKGFLNKFQKNLIWPLKSGWDW